MPSAASHTLFTYGSLMCTDIMAQVSGAELPPTPATLHDYARFCVQDEEYPGVIAQAGGTVAGILYQGIQPAHWKRLDAFEGEMYERCPVAVLLAAGQKIMADCYVFRSAFAHRLTKAEWDFAAFQRSGKSVFQHQYCGFKAID